MRKTKEWNRHGEAYPHVGGCEGCHAERVCNVCGADTRKDRGRCTNGRCTTCHVAVCTAGGDTSPGHGYGSVGQAHALAREYETLRKGDK